MCVGVAGKLLFTLCSFPLEALRLPSHGLQWVSGDLKSFDIGKISKQFSGF